MFIDDLLLFDFDPDKINIGDFKNELRRKIQSKLQNQCLPGKLTSSEIKTNSATESKRFVDNETTAANIKQAESLQREHEMRTLLSLTNRQNKSNSQARILAQFR